MKEIRIPKRSGGVCIVVSPGRRMKQTLRGLLPQLEAVAIALDVFGVQHGFTPGRSPVTNAAAHVGFRYTVSFDLADCFDHVTLRKVRAVYQDAPSVAFYATAEVMNSGDAVARQGLPTSPAMCNIALAPLDAMIVRWLDGRGVYTRYADDLTISTDDKAVVDEAMYAVPGFCEYEEFPVNHRKTEVQDARAGRRHITGVAVDDLGVHPTRSVKRRLRAALHQKKQRQAAGLAEWARLKPPNSAAWCLARLTADHCDPLATMVLVRDR